MKLKPVYTTATGTALLEDPLLNKGTAFTEAERAAFNLHGLLPIVVESLDEQRERAYQQFRQYEQPLERYNYLRNLQDTNETLFYQLLHKHLSEMIPIIYTPTVGQACQQFSHIYRHPRGLVLSYPNRHHLDTILQNVGQREIRVIVMTDGQRILGLGDQGAGGMGIPIGKLSLYTACGGIDPAYTLPILLDVGTDNPQHLSDPLYLGWRQPRLEEQIYEEFVDQCIQAIQRRWPNVVLQFEDFAHHNAVKLLDRYQKQICCFNDDIQGTAAVTLACLLAACQAADSQLSQQTIVFLGSGSAGCGIAELMITQMQSEGLTEQQARRQIFMVGSKGLTTDQLTHLPPYKYALAQSSEAIKHWTLQGNHFSLWDVVHHAKPTVLIGVCGQPKLFDEPVIKEMYRHCQRPIIMPLSNPTSQAEAHPSDLLAWTQGAALIATGSPFAAVDYQGKSYPIAQCNNSYIFPGLGLGLLIGQATQVTEKMLLAASQALADCSPLACQGSGMLLPAFESIRQVSSTIAIRVAQAAQDEGVSPITDEASLQQRLNELFWTPEYRPYLPLTTL
ncbi:MAG: NAD-dependent malic enzyme [Candidatus Symbiodolus clandestinus]